LEYSLDLQEAHGRRNNALPRLPFPIAITVRRSAPSWLSSLLSKAVWRFAPSDPRLRRAVAYADQRQRRQPPHLLLAPIDEKSSGVMNACKVAVSDDSAEPGLTAGFQRRCLRTGAA
jgi:hypothetical protein